MPIVLRSLTRRALAILAVAGLLAGSIVVLGAPQSAEAATHTVSGVVYRDFDGDGVRDTSGTGLNGIQVDAGLAGVAVTITDAHGTTWTGTTGATGAYSISVVDPFTTKLRVTFATPSPYQPSTHGTGNRTSVQFIDVATTQNAVNYAVNVPEDYAQTNAPLVTAIEYAGLRNTPTLANSPTLVSTPWDRNYILSNDPVWETANYPGRTTLATVPQTGSLWATAYDPITDTLYAAATYKRQSALGPLGLGGIYRKTDLLAADGTINTGAGVTNWLDVSAASPGLGINVGSVASDATRGLGTPQTPARDLDAFAQAAKVGIGGMAIDPVGRKLYFINLNDKRLYAIDLTVATPTAANVQSWSLGLGHGKRPWAVEIHRGQVYVGYVDSGENPTTGSAQPGNAATGSFYVMTTPTSGPGSWTNVLTGSLGYTKGQVAPDPSAQEIRWNSWTDTWNWGASGSVGVLVTTWGADYNAQIYPQPILSDLSFDDAGYLVLAFTDRTSIQSGNRSYSATSLSPADNNTYESMSNGDLLIAAPAGGGGFTLENNGTVATRTTANGSTTQGPGGREFFWDRHALGTGTSHQENALGAVATKPGVTTVVATAFDPLNDIRVAGQNWFSLTNGDPVAGYQHNIDTGGTVGVGSAGRDALATGTFQKAGGIGDIELIARSAPLEIGNRVWFDADQDGVQDADEVAIPNMVVELYQGATATGSPIATATTDANGEYYFSSTTTAAFTPNGGAYTVKFVKPTSGNLFAGNATYGTVPWTAASFTTPNVGVNDNVDSDAITSGNDATIPYTAGSPGENDHTLDAGLVANAYFQVTKAIDPAGPTPAVGTTFAMTAQARDFRGDAITLAAADASFSLAAGDTKTISLPVGSDALVNETSTAGIQTKTVAPATWFDVVGSSTTPTAVTVTNRMTSYGTFTVTKGLSGTGAAIVPASTTFDLEYSIDGGANWIALPPVTAGTTTAAVSLPTGTAVRVRELTPPVVPGVTWQNRTWSGTGVSTMMGQARFTIGDSTAVAVTVTNPSTRGNVGFSVTKAVTGTGAATVPNNYDFTVNYSYVNGASTVTGSLTVRKGNTSNGPTNVPYGTVVTLSEVTPTGGPATVGFGTPVFSGTGVTNNGDGTATFVAGATTSITLTNPATLLNGSFTVTKSVTGTGSALGSAAGPFTVEYSTTGAAPWTSLSVPAGGTSSSVTLPTGTTVTVREVAPSAVTGITWGTPVWSGTGVTAGPGNTATFTVGNATTVAVGLQNPTTLLNGLFTVTKSVTGTGSALGSAAGPFTVEYSTTGGAPWSTLSVPANGTSSSVTLPYGSIVTVREVAPSAVTGISWGTPVWSGTGVTAGAGNTATFTIGSGTTVVVGLQNPTTLLNGTFNVTKAVTGSGSTLGSTAGPFTVEYSTTGTAPWTSLSVPAGGTSSSVSLPHGTIVTVREVAPSAVTGITWGTPVWSGTDVTAGAGNTATFTIGASTTVAVALENPTTLLNGQFTVTKSVTGAGSALGSSAGPFTVEYSTTGTAPWTTLSVPANGTSASVTLPHGTPVTVREVAPAAVTGITWGTPVWSGTGVTAGAGNTATFTIAASTTVAVGLQNPTTLLDGLFNVTKSVTGSGSSLGSTAGPFTVEYSTTGSAPWTSLSVPAGGTSASVSLPYGSIVTVREVAPAAVTGISWGTPVWSGTGVTAGAGNTATFTVGSGTTVAVGLENPTTLLNGQFTVTKSVTGTGSSLGSTAGPFTVEYSTTGTAPWTSLSVPAGGTSASVSLPHGTSVTVREVAPSAVTGITWGTPVWSGTGVTAGAGNTATFTIGAGTTVVVGLQNPTTLLNGLFTVTKSVTGDGAALGSTAGPFTVEYSTTGGAPWTTLSVPAGGTSASVSLPHGTTVTVREVAPSAVTGIVWGTPLWSGSGVTAGPGNTATFTIANGTTVAVGLENPTQRVRTGFSVTKSVTGLGEPLVAAGTSFTVNYSYLDGATPVAGSLTVTKGSPVGTLGNVIPFGATVEIAEVVPAGISGLIWGTPVITGTGVTDNGDGTATFVAGVSSVSIQLENPTTRLGGFTVTKSVTGLGETLVPNSFAFTVNYSYILNSVLTNGQLVLTKDAPTQSVSGIPYGTEVTLTENVPGALSGVQWDPKVWSGSGVTSSSGVATLTIGSSPVVAVGLENPTTRLGGFTVTKSVTGSGEPIVPDAFEFTANYSYTVDSVPVTGQLVLTKSAPTQGVSGIPYGTEVTLTEDTPGVLTDVRWDGAVWSGVPSAAGEATVTIGSSPVVAVGLENPTTRLGGLSVTKTVSGSANSLVPNDFEFTVDYSYTVDSVLTTGELVLTKDDPTAGLSGIPYGTVVTLTEAVPGALTDVRWDPKVWSGTGVTSAAGVATLTIGSDPVVFVGLENPTTRLGGFSVTKIVTGDAAGSVPNDFVFHVTYSYGATTGQFQLTKAAPTASLSGLPVGTVVTLTETAPTGGPVDVAWGTPAFSVDGGTPGASATFTIGATPVAVILDNHTDRLLGAFTVTKNVSGSAAASVPNNFVFTVHYSYTVDSVLNTGQFLLSKNAPTDGLSGLPYGTVVTLTEDDPTGAPVDVQWTGKTWSGLGVSSSAGVATLTIGSTPVAAGLENTTTQLVGDLKISKSVTGSALGSVPPGFNFTVHFSYGTTSGDRTITDGASVVLTGIPAGTVVTLSEAPSVGAPVDVQWETPIWRHGSVTDTGTTTVTVVAGTEVEVALENPTTRLYNGFSLTKVVSGDAAGSVPNDFEFTVTYSPAGTPAGPLVLTKAAPSASVTGLPLGTVVTLTETAPGSAAPDVAWGTPVFTGTTFTNNPDGSVSFTITAAPIAVVLTNPTTRLYGDFSITKDVTGPAEDTLDDDFEFSGTYSYTGISPVPFTIENGQSWTLPYADRIPAGTTVTVTETTPMGGLPALSGWGTPAFSGTGVTGNGPGSATFVIGANTTIAVGLENPTTVTPRVDIEKGDGVGSVIAHDADTMPDGEHYEPGETRTIVFRVTNTGTEDLRQVLLTDDTLSGADVESISWAFPDGSTADAALVGENWVARWEATFASGTSFWVPGDVIIGTATLTVEAADDAHVDNARVDAVGRYSGTAVEDEDAYNAFTGDIQIIKYDGRIAGPSVQSGGDWVIPAKPLANPFQDANDDAHAAQSIANVPVRIDWVVTNIGTTTLTDVMVRDTTLLGPSIDAWTCDLSDVGGPAVYSFLNDGPWAGLLEPSASFFCTGSVTLVAGGKHTDVADVEAHVIFPEVDGNGIPSGNPMLDGDDLPVLALDDQGHPVVVADDDPFLDPVAIELASTGVEPWMPLAAGIAVLSVLLGALAVALPRRRRSVARHR